MSHFDNPAIVQSDFTILLDVHHPKAPFARDLLNAFCELQKSPEHIHTYKITPISLWNAASAGLDSDTIIKNLSDISRYELPQPIIAHIQDITNRYGKIILDTTNTPNLLELKIDDSFIKNQIIANKKIMKFISYDNEKFLVALLNRGTIKQELINIGFPVKDLAPLRDGRSLTFSLRENTLSGMAFSIRDYQQEAVENFYANNMAGSGYGTIVLPCGAGKTIVAIATIQKYQTATLILTTNVAAVHQWQNELLDKTSLTEKEIGEYSGDKKNIKPITIATYQIITWRANTDDEFPHFNLFKDTDWGLIIYDEVHLLPAPVFRITAEIQAIRRLGLTATLIREDGKESDVFSLVGPKRYDVPWKQLENSGWIAQAICKEIRLELPEELKIEYAIADKKAKFRIAAENPRKIDIAKEIIKNHEGESILIIGQYVAQLEKIAKELDVPLITGKTPNQQRELIYEDFKKGRISLIVVSKVANFAIDLPDASVAIQVAGTFGSRQEEAQRLGRILRPKKRSATFYTIVTKESLEAEFAINRQRFLAEQGYKYEIENYD